MNRQAEVQKQAAQPRATAPIRPATPQKPAMQQASRPAAPVRQPASPNPLPSIQSSQQMTDMLNEMRNMRSVIESQLTAISWGNIQQRDPIKSKMLSTLLSAGFSAALSRQLTEKCLKI